MILGNVHFTQREAAIVEALRQTSMAGNELILSQWYGRDRSPWAHKTLSVIRGRVRKKLRRLGITLHTARGWGVFVSAEDWACLRAL